MYLPLLIIRLYQGCAVLHLKDGILAEVNKTFHLLLIPAITDSGVEECLLRLLDLRFLPLVQLVLVNFKVNSFNLEL